MTKQEAAEDARASMVDELGALEAELAPYKPKLARVDVLRAALRAPFSDSPPKNLFNRGPQVYCDDWSMRE